MSLLHLASRVPATSCGSPLAKKHVDHRWGTMQSIFKHNFGRRHEACNHSKGLFCTKKRIRKKHVLIHTGGVDVMWRLSKSAIACSLPTRTNRHVNLKLMQSIRVWQWRWMNSKTRCEREKHGVPFQEQFPCKLQDIIISNSRGILSLFWGMNQ